MPEQIGRFPIIREIAQGGMATVYLGRDLRLDRDVAIKVISSAQQSADFQQSFEQEARILAALEHPNILPIYEFGEDNGRPFIVARYMPEGSLKDRLNSTPLSPTETSRILTKVAAALTFAHSRNVIHRDIKLSNILLDERNEPLLSDFGIARFTADTDTVTDIGTPPYMAPEQWQKRPIDARTDVYQLGIMLYEMLTHQRPFQANNRDEYKRQHLSAPVPSVRQANPQLSPLYDAVIQKATAKDPNRRYATPDALAAAFAQAVAAAANDDTRTADDPPSPRRARWWVSGALGTVIVLLAVWGLWGRGYWGGITAVPSPTPSPSVTAQLISLGESATPAPTDPPPPSATPSATPSVTPSASPTASPSATPSATATASLTPTPTPDPFVPPANPTAASRWLRPQDQMPLRFVPGGRVTLGVDDTAVAALNQQCALVQSPDLCAALIADRTQPLYQVTLPAYWLDEMEVSNRQYALCVAAGACSLPAKMPAAERAAYYEQPDFADYPMIYTTWDEARRYCQWTGGDLPDEDQWAYAARSAALSLYPWGDRFDGNKANFCDLGCSYAWRENAYDDGAVQTAPAAAYATGLGWTGAAQLAGNVWEWTRSDLVLPSAPQAQTGKKVIRGGSWATNSYLTSSAIREGLPPDTANNATGFRCVRP